MWGVATAFVLLSASMVYLGMQLGSRDTARSVPFPVTDLGEQLGEQRQLIDEAKRQAQDDLNALAQRLAQLQARIIRLDALGQRLVEISQLDAEEFNFDEAQPALGGPSESESQLLPGVHDFIGDLERVSQDIADREQKLDALSELLVTDRVEQEVSPQGRPISKGWISSYYGKRTDPVTGKKAFHEGIDFAGKGGTEIKAVAAGIVTWAGKRHGYGNVIEITHGNGLVTRYGHNKENIVTVGDRVAKGQTIALMGSTGRSTGPHVHFEVIKDGKTVNPLKFVKAGA